MLKDFQAALKKGFSRLLFFCLPRNAFDYSKQNCWKPKRKISENRTWFPEKYARWVVRSMAFQNRIKPAALILTAYGIEGRQQ